MARLTLCDHDPKERRLTTVGSRSEWKDPNHGILHRKVKRPATSLEKLNVRLTSATDELVEQMGRLSLSSPKVEVLPVIEQWWQENTFMLEEDPLEDFEDWSTFLDLWPRKGPEKCFALGKPSSEYHNALALSCSSTSAETDNEILASPSEGSSDLAIKSLVPLVAPLQQSHPQVPAKSILARIGTVGIRSGRHSSPSEWSLLLVPTLLTLDVSGSSPSPTSWDVD